MILQHKEPGGCQGNGDGDDADPERCPLPERPPPFVKRAHVGVPLSIEEARNRLEGCCIISP